VLLPSVHVRCYPKSPTSLIIQGALFLAVESLLVECQRWFGTIASQTSAMSVPLDFIIEVWYFAEEHGEFFCYSVLTFPGNIFHFEQNLINSLSFFSGFGYVCRCYFCSRHLPKISSSEFCRYNYCITCIFFEKYISWRCLVPF
jgi:hypothetical protein